MDDRGIAEELVEHLTLKEGSLDLRPVHALGIGATGHFEAEPIAARYCIAEHFQGGKVDVSVRFSNGSGDATRHDGWSDVRGMATRFHLSGGAATDLIAMTLPEFFAPTPDTFLAFAKKAEPKDCHRESPWRKILALLKMTLPTPDPYPGQKKRPDDGAIRFADENKYAQQAVLGAAAIGAPVSYARAEYHAVHTFIITGPPPENVRRWVRFTWQPVSGVLNEPPRPSPRLDYLNDELRDRLGAAPARFTLTMTIGEIGDKFDDPTRSWPPHRTRIMMGTLTLDKVPDEAEQTSMFEKQSFNPWLLTDGIAPSDDPVLRVRRDAYEYSSKRRASTPCPFAKG